MTTPYKLLVPTATGTNYPTRWHTPGLTPDEWTPEKWTTSDKCQHLYQLDPAKWYQERTLTYYKGSVITHLRAPRVGWVDGSSPTLMNRDGVWDNYEIWEVDAPAIPVVP